MKKFYSLILILLILFNFLVIPKDNIFSQTKIDIIGYGPLYDDICYPFDVAIDSMDRVYVADKRFPYIKVYDFNSNFLFNFGSFGINKGELVIPFAIDIDRINNRLAVIDNITVIIERLPFIEYGICRVQIFDLNGKFLFELKEFRNKEFGIPSAVEFDNEGNLYVLTSGEKAVKIFDKNGKFIKEIIDQKLIEGYVDFTINIKNNKIYVLCIPKWTEQKVHIFNLDGEYIGNFKKDDFYWPQGIDSDEDGLIYVSNDGRGTVEIFDSNGKFLKNFGAKGIITGYAMRPRRLCVGNKKVVVADTFNGRVNVYTDVGGFISQIGKTKNLTDLFVYPTDVDLDSKENIYIVDLEKMIVSKFDKNHTPLLSFGGYSETSKPNSLIWPYGIYINSKDELYITNNYYYGSNLGNSKIKKFSKNGIEMMRFGTPGSDKNQYEAPSGICSDKYGNLYIADYGNNRVQKVKDNGDFLKIFELKDESFIPLDVAVDSNLNLYAVDPVNNKILVFNKDGSLIKTFNQRAVSIYIDNLDRIWITDPDIDSIPIKILDKDGNIIKQFGYVGGPVTIGNVLTNPEDYKKDPGKFLFPAGLVVKFNNLYVVDNGNKRVQKIPLNLIFQDLNIDLLNPKDNEIIYKNLITFLWNVKENFNNVNFQIQISSDEKFENIIYEKNIENENKIELNIGDLNLEKGKAYFWRVRGFNELFYGNWSQIYKFKLEEIIKPYPPSDIKVSIEKNYIKINWSKSDEGSFPISGYEIFRGLSKDNLELLAVVDKETTNYIDKDINYNLTYYYSVRAFDNFEPKNYSEFSNIVFTILEDKNPPEIYLSLPSETYESSILISGYVSDDISGIKDNIIYINGNKVNLTNDLKFNYRLSLLEGVNFINFEVTDNAGNKRTKKYEIKFINRIIIKLQIGNRKMMVNNFEQEIDVSPKIIEGRTLLPIRYIAEPLGAQISWNGNEKKITISFKEKIIELWIGKNIAKINGIETPIDPNNPKVVPLIIQGRTMLPVRFVAENLGCKVEWNAKTKTITIIYPSD